MSKKLNTVNCTVIISALTLAFFLMAPLARAGGYANPELIVDTEVLAHVSGGADVAILDVRPAAAYRKGHIPGAVHLGADDIVDKESRIESALLPEAKLAEMLGERGVGKNTKVILYDDKGGFHAARLFWLLEYFGHRDVAILNGGFPKWEKEGRKVTKAVPKVNKVNFPLDLTARKIATADWLLDRRNDSNVVIVDVRPTKMYDQGHIPWAKSIPWAKNLSDESVLKTADDLTKHFESFDITKDRNVVVHCQVGKAAAHSYYTLRVLGFPRVRSYDRSWAEWGADKALPKASKMAVNR